jgi:uncharacterized protein (TIGR02466 family)
MDLLDLFPKTIGVATLQTLTPDVIRRAIAYIEAAEKIVDIESDGAYTVEQQILDDEIFKDVREELIGLCKQLSESYCHVVDGLRICNSWGNVIAHGQSIRNHRHNNSYLSGSFYLSGGSSFILTNLGSQDLFGFMPKVNGGNYRSWDSFSIRPKPGGIVVFPSGLFHSVVPSKDREKRYSVAFNVVPQGVIGVPTSLLDMGRA